MPGQLGRQPLLPRRLRPWSPFGYKGHGRDPKGALAIRVRDGIDHFGLSGRSDGNGISIFGSQDIWIDHVSMTKLADLKRLQLSARDGPSDPYSLAKWRILNRLHDRNETMYYKVISIPLLSIYPFIVRLSGLVLFLVLISASMLKNVLSISITTGLLVIQNRAVSQEQRGAANGISMTAMSLCKAIGPAAGGVHLVFFALNVVEFIGLVSTFRPFMALPQDVVSDFATDLESR
ncbi:protein zinc induced facilitator-like 1 [Phtheirospermum japonicum]|uniref:Protein zinc induced facilitator-like 1 n=1 Tax=Phtheirospermum japonicum TaxID=374723 RepID=A0A830CRC4_9LAMI|nr:protein zinc induced facilitator-like 1 [Phtheirospermum japonicum]